MIILEIELKSNSFYSNYNKLIYILSQINFDII
jgi:hypothetical protein